MAGIACIARPSPITLRSTTKARRRRCCRSMKSMSKEGSTGPAPKLIELAVSGVTEIVRVLSPVKDDSLESVSDDEQDGVPASSVDDVAMFLTSDYEKAYFVTGVFSSAIYAEDCIFEDPTIRFRGKGLYERNLKLLVPFFDHPSIIFHSIQKGDDETYILARWKPRTYLKLPWRPLISIDGKTVYELDNNFAIVRHAESWNVSALEAIGRIFTPLQPLDQKWRESPASGGLLRSLRARRWRLSKLPTSLAEFSSSSDLSIRGARFSFFSSSLFSVSLSEPSTLFTLKMLVAGDAVTP